MPDFGEMEESPLLLPLDISSEKTAVNAVSGLQAQSGPWYFIKH